MFDRNEPVLNFLLESSVLTVSGSEDAVPECRKAAERREAISKPCQVPGWAEPIAAAASAGLVICPVALTRAHSGLPVIIGSLKQ